jgi:hypothetical protein
MMRRSTFSFLVVLSVIMMFSSCCPCKSDKNIQMKPGYIDDNLLEMIFEEFHVIGEGRNYMTVLINRPRQLGSEYSLYALALDSQRQPIRKISSFGMDPKIQDKRFYWFHFFLYAPGNHLRAFPKSGAKGTRTSSYIQFVVKKGDEIIKEKIVKWEKEWANETQAPISDFPIPPDQIHGYLELGDYTFFAENDIRKPKGYYVTGQINGNEGKWTNFVPLSLVQGKVTKPEEGTLLKSDQGWLELSTGKNHSMKEAISPIAPYIKGWWDGKGYFNPEPLTIYGLE